MTVVYSWRPMARYLIVADIHSNLVALEAVLKDAGSVAAFECMWVLGDIVGYGPEPAGCIARVTTEQHVCVAGNHDLGVAGAIDLMSFNADAARACLWTRDILGVKEMEFLRMLPTESVEPPFLLVHGSPLDPAWEYLTSAEQVIRALNQVRVSTHCMVGHTHRPAAYLVREDGRVDTQRIQNGTELHVDYDRLLLNPGAVGQPRDGDPRAGYAIYDDSSRMVSFHRTEYDVARVSEQIRINGLPEWFGTRLHLGY